MKPYKVYIDITNRYSVEIHGHDQNDVQAQAEKLSKHQIEDGGNYEEIVGIEVVDIEPLYQEADEDEEIVKQAIKEGEIEEEGDETDTGIPRVSDNN